MQSMRISKLRNLKLEVLYKKGVLKNFARFSGEHLCRSLFLSKVGELRPATLLTKRVRLMYFSVNFAVFYKSTFLQNIFGGGCLRIKIKNKDLINPWVCDPSSRGDIHH